ncbi:hypothetical protein [Enterococcus sp. DIV0876]|uniref:hypothetical protein n=1 Tax=Enterococcus sp. DIV0876 TaxID=2774633 RepID=UPI003D2FF34F
MEKPKIIFRLDGSLIESELIDKFQLRNYARNLRFSYAKKGEVLDFVGFIIQKNEILVSLPKHYSDIDDLKMLSNEDVELLFNVLIQEQVRNVGKYNRDIKEFDSNFPFEAFYSIYQYFQQYGLYQEKKTVAKPGYNGKIFWKDTIRKATNVISNGNLVYLPLFIKETQEKQVFLSGCMAFAINYTLMKFPYFVHGKSPGKHLSNFDFWENRDYVVGKLKRIYTELFKDIHKKLVHDLIDFFLEVPENGSISVKHYNFELVWETMVEKYLNDFFVGFGDGGMMFGENGNFQFNKKNFNIDKAHPANRIEPDHYFRNDEIQFIIDAKYYSKIYELNHKQVAYHTFLKKLANKTYNALILPTEGVDHSKEHFELKEEYYVHSDDKIMIWEYYLNMKNVMNNFIRK